MDSTLTPAEWLREAVERAGSQAALARICGVKQPSVWQWLNEGKELPAEHVLKVEAATGVSRHDLRPDIYPREDGPCAPPAGTGQTPAGGSSSSTDALEGVRA